MNIDKNFGRLLASLLNWIAPEHPTNNKMAVNVDANYQLTPTAIALSEIKHHHKHSINRLFWNLQES